MPFPRSKRSAYEGRACMPSRLPYRGELVAPLPFRPQVVKDAAALRLGFRVFDQRKRLAARQLEQFAVAQRIGNVEAQLAVLARAKKLPRTAQLQVDLRDLKAVCGAHHGLQAHPRAVVCFAVNLLGRPQDAVGFFRASPDAPSELVEL